MFIKRACLAAICGIAISNAFSPSLTVVRIRAKSLSMLNSCDDSIDLNLIPRRRVIHSTLISATTLFLPQLVVADSELPTQPSLATSSKNVPQVQPDAAVVVTSIHINESSNPQVLKQENPLSESLTQEKYAISIQKSTSSLSNYLGHAILVVDGLNSQARRLSTSSSPSHLLAVLEGMNTKAKSLLNDLDYASASYKTILEQAKLITVSDESFGSIVSEVTHASSVLDGLIVQSKRLVNASSNKENHSTDDQIVYLLSVLDGLNIQMRRLNVSETFGLLDKLNSKAVEFTAL